MLSDQDIRIQVIFLNQGPLIKTDPRPTLIAMGFIEGLPKSSECDGTHEVHFGLRSDMKTLVGYLFPRRPSIEFKEYPADSSSYHYLLTETCWRRPLADNHPERLIPGMIVARRTAIKSGGRPVYSFMGLVTARPGELPNMNQRYDLVGPADYLVAEAPKDIEALRFLQGTMPDTYLQQLGWSFDGGECVGLRSTLSLWIVREISEIYRLHCDGSDPERLANLMKKHAGLLHHFGRDADYVNKHMPAYWSICREQGLDPFNQAEPLTAAQKAAFDAAASRAVKEAVLSERR